MSNVDFDMGSISPCNEEEADTRMMLHMKSIAEEVYYLS